MIQYLQYKTYHLVSNQIRSYKNVLLKPDWDYEVNKQDYRLLTLNESLSNNPSITVSMSYQK